MTISLRRGIAPRLLTLLLVVALPLVASVGCDDDEADGTDGICIPGALDCACTEEGTCDQGLECNDQSVCQAPDGVEVTGLVVSDASARSCEVMLQEAAGVEILDANWGADTTGALRREAPKVALAFTRTTDAAFATDSVALQLRGAVSDVTISETRCYDAESNLLDGATVEFR